MAKRSERLSALELKDKTIAKQSATSSRTAPPPKSSSAPKDSHSAPETADKASSAQKVPSRTKRAASSASPHTQKSSKRPRTEEVPASAKAAAKNISPQAPAIKTTKVISPKKVRFQVVKKGGKKKSGVAKVKSSFGCVVHMSVSSFSFPLISALGDDSSR